MACFPRQGAICIIPENQKNILMFRQSLALVAALLLSFPVLAQSIQVGQGRDQKSIQLVRTDTPPVIDAVLDDAVWANAAVIDEFHQIIPVEYAAPTERTEVRILFDDDALYVGVKMFIDPRLITANILKQNTTIFGSDDYFSISFDSFNTKRGGYFFGVNPNGVRADGLYRNISQFYADWDSIYQAEARIVDDGWIAEFEIPFKSISFDPNIDTWGMNFSRRIQTRNEQMVWVSNDRRFDPSSAGLATGLTGLRQGLGLDIVPSFSVTQERNFSTVGGADINTQPSVDMFYKLTSGMNASFTANTDFSATEVDDRQVNLTRFSLFFPEKRDFFLREADIFEFGRLNQNGRPFFSRRIGLGGNGQAIDLEAGAKISGRIGDWELGALSIRQDGTATVAPDTLSVLRVRKGLLRESALGLIVTEGNPTSNLKNTLVGTDFLYRKSNLPGGRVFELSSWLQQSDTEGVSSDDAAAGITVGFPSQEGLTGQFTFNRFEQNFNPALGFANRTGVDESGASLNYTWRPDSSPFQALNFGVDFERFDDMAGQLQSESLSITPLDLTTKIGDGMFLRSNFSKENLLTPFRIHPSVVIPAGLYDFENHGIEFRSAPFRKVSGRIAYTDGTFYGGHQSRLFGNLTWQPSPKIRTSLGFNFTDVELPEGAFITRLLTANLDYVFSNTLSWVNLVQYDNISETLGINMRLQWIPQAGQEYFFVVNHNMEDVDRDNRFHSAVSTVTAKFSYTFRY
jgi:hypothetical protein